MPKLHGTKQIEAGTIERDRLASGSAYLRNDEQINANNQKIVNLAAPADETDAATKAYVDEAVENVEPEINAGAGLTKTGTTINVVSADSSLSVNENDVSVNLNSAGGLETSSGLKLKLPANSALEITVGGVKVKVDDASVKVAGNSLSVNLKAAGGLENDNGLKLKLQTASALETTENGLKVQVDNSSILVQGGNSLAVNLDEAGGLETGDGLKLKLQTVSALETGADGLKVSVDNQCLQIKEGDNQLTVTLNPTGGIEINDGLKLKLQTSSALETAAGGLKVKVDGSTVEISETNELAVSINGAGGIEVDDGLKLKLPVLSGLETAAGGVKVNAHEDSIQLLGSNQIAVNPSFFKINEVPSGAGGNYVTSDDYYPGSLEVYLERQVLIPGTDFEETGLDSFSLLGLVGDENLSTLRVSYIKNIDIS